MAEQLFQIAAKALIRNAEGKILMVHLPEWGNNPEHWDLPGGRLDPGEDFVEALRRELKEEISVMYTAEPEQITAMLTNITIPVGDTQVPLVFVIYAVELETDAVIQLDPKSNEDKFEWFSPKDAAANMAIKFSPEFCSYVGTLQ